MPSRSTNQKVIKRDIRAIYRQTDSSIKEEGFGLKEVLKAQLAAMREEIAGDNPSPLEQLLAERIVLTWLQIQLFEGLYASNMSKGTRTIPQRNYEQKRIDQAYRRHLSAIRTLAQIRKLGLAVQINIAEKQINTMGEGIPGS